MNKINIEWVPPKEGQTAEEYVALVYEKCFIACQKEVNKAIKEIIIARDKSNFIQSQFAYDTAIEIIKRHIGEINEETTEA